MVDDLNQLILNGTEQYKFHILAYAGLLIFSAFKSLLLFRLLSSLLTIGIVVGISYFMFANVPKDVWVMFGYFVVVMALWTPVIFFVAAMFDKRPAGAEITADEYLLVEKYLHYHQPLESFIVSEVITNREFDKLKAAYDDLVKDNVKLSLNTAKE